VRTAAEGHDHFDGLDKLGETMAFPRPGADRAFLFAEVRITHDSLPGMEVDLSPFPDL
jgi:hypothetical protein